MALAHRSYGSARVVSPRARRSTRADARPLLGTRGSIPVGLTAADIRDKLARALVAASGRRFESYGEAYAFADETLPFAVSHTYGGHTSCVELDMGASDE